jgi:uncharacterized protein YndB with AHSA1/START domain
MSEAVPEAPEPQALQIQRRFAAGRDDLYRYFTEASHLAAWFGPKGVVCKSVRADAIVGGSYAIEMVNPDGSGIVLVGRFLQLDPPQLIRMTWRWQRENEIEPDEETVVTIRLSAVGSETLLRLTHERFGEVAERDRHESGWSSTLDCLDELIAQRSTKG